MKKGIQEINPKLQDLLLPSVSEFQELNTDLKFFIN